MKLLSFQGVFQLLYALAAFILCCQINVVRPYTIGHRNVHTDSNRRHNAGSFAFLSDPGRQAGIQTSGAETDWHTRTPVTKSALEVVEAENAPTSSLSPPVSRQAASHRGEEQASDSLAVKESSETSLSGQGREPSLNVRHKRATTARAVGGSTLNGSAVTANADSPFLRRKRAASGSGCSLPANLPEQVHQLNAFLKEWQSIGPIPTQEDYIELPKDQPPSRCPAPLGSWWPRPEVNLRSTCPWTWEELDNGPDTYPRHIVQAKCMCTSCIHATSMSCQEIRHDVTIFRVQGCQDGVALMKREIVTVTLGCFCAAPEPNNANQGSSGDDDDHPLTD